MHVVRENLEVYQPDGSRDAQNVRGRDYGSQPRVNVPFYWQYSRDFQDTGHGDSTGARESPHEILSAGVTSHSKLQLKRAAGT